jgi:hypothetical protein
MAQNNLAEAGPKTSVRINKLALALTDMHAPNRAEVQHS